MAKSINITKTMVSVDINESGILSIIDFNPLKNVGVHIINIDGTEELDVWLESKIVSDKMISKVAEYTKTARGDWQLVDSNLVSTRYKNLTMLLDNSSYVDSDGNILSDYNDIYEDDLDKEILNDDKVSEPVSYEPKQYEQKLKEGLIPAFTFFESFNRFKTMMFNIMSNR